MKLIRYVLLSTVLLTSLSIVSVNTSYAAYSVDDSMTSFDLNFLISEYKNADMSQTFAQSFTAYKKQNKNTKMTASDYKLTFSYFEQDKKRLVALAAFIFRDNPGVDKLSITVEEKTKKKRFIAFVFDRELMEILFGEIPSYPGDKSWDDKSWYKKYKSKILSSDTSSVFASKYSIFYD